MYVTLFFCNNFPINSQYKFIVHCCFYFSFNSMKGTAAFIDAEHALDPIYARNLGVDIEGLLICQVRSICGSILHCGKFVATSDVPNILN